MGEGQNVYLPPPPRYNMPLAPLIKGDRAEKEIKSNVTKRQFTLRDAMKKLLAYPLNFCDIQGDQLNLAVCFWYLAKSDLSSEHYTCTLAYTGLVTFDIYQKKHSHVYLVGL